MPLEDHLLTESRNPRSEAIDTLSPSEIVRLMNSEDARVVEAVAAESVAIARAIEWAADRFRRGGRLVYVGAGTSGRLGVLDAAECPPTFSTPPEMVVGLIAGGNAALTPPSKGPRTTPTAAPPTSTPWTSGRTTSSSGSPHRGGPPMCWRRPRGAGEVRRPSASPATVPACSERRLTSTSPRSSAPRSSRAPRG